ncbi:MAG: copper chaperone PCu(A)C [Zoogloeaceae bacterium]|jgi:copper(I)-binding protein|nr:copper chaperone PCu(A)C [Zoogloeaceae bacterium]
MRGFFLLLTLLFLQTAWAQTPQAQVMEAWVRATVAGQQSTGAFLTLQSAVPLKLVEVRSPLAAAAEIHEMRVDDDGVMRMRAVSWLNVPAGKATQLKPGGYHIMLLELKAQAKAGERTTLTLVLEDAARQRQEIEVIAEIRALNAPPRHMPQQ